MLVTRIRQVSATSTGAIALTQSTRRRSVILMNETNVDAWLVTSIDAVITKGFLLHQYVPIYLREILGDNVTDSYNVRTSASTATIDIIESLEG